MIDRDDPGYRPIDCGIHDQLESLAVRRATVAFTWMAGDGSTASTTATRILDIRVANGAEWLVLEDGTSIRLDRLLEISLPRGEGAPPPGG